MPFRFFFPLVFSVLITLAGCSDSDSDDFGYIPYDIEIPFQAVAGNTLVNCDAILAGLGTSGVDAGITAFAFYVHDVTLVTNSGRELELELDENAFQAEGVALLDYQDRNDMCSGEGAKATNKMVAGRYFAYPGVEIETLRFTLGVPEALNHGDTAAAPSPLNRLDLHWNWQGGYKFLRTDIAPEGGVFTESGSVASWNFHLGSTGCEGDPELGEVVECSAPNRAVIELDGFDPDSDMVVFNYAALVASSTVNADQGGAPGCMSGASDPECAALFDALGLGIAGNPDPTPGQLVFSLTSQP